MGADINFSFSVAKAFIQASSKSKGIPCMKRVDKRLQYFGEILEKSSIEAGMTKKTTHTLH